MDKQVEQLQQQINALKNEVEELRLGYHRNNFSQVQIFNKYSDFTFRLKVPVVGALATAAEVGELCVYGGELYVASALNTWALVGTQS